MSQFIVNPVALKAGVKKSSAWVSGPANLTSAVIQLTDSTGATQPATNSNWLHTAGNVTEWGIEYSLDGGATSAGWLVGPYNFAFGTLLKDGKSMPEATISSSAALVAAGGMVRESITVDTNITLGNVITTTP